MSGKYSDYGRCLVCNRKLRRTAERCNECSRLFGLYKRRYPNKSHEHIDKMIMDRHKSHKYNKYLGGAKPKFLKVVNVIR